MTQESRRHDAPSSVAELALAPDFAAVRVARRFVETECRRGGLDEETSYAAVLLTSEAVTNAFAHGRSEARIRVTLWSARVLLEVADDNSRHPQRAAEDVDALDGRGVAIVEQLASRWGVRDDPYGKTVWFELVGSERPGAR